MLAQTMKHILGLTLFSVSAGLIAMAANPKLNTTDAVYELDFDLLQRLAHTTMLDQVEWPDAADWKEFWTFLDDALHAQSLDDLAAAYPGVQRAMSYLQSNPDVRPYAAWLRQRQDYFDMARQVELLYPAKPAAPVQKPPPMGKIRLAPPHVPVMDLPVELIRKRNAYIQSQSVWTQKLRGRMKPEDAAFLIPVLKDAFETEGVSAAWVWMAEVESTLNPQARSPVGAAGLFQFMPATAKRFGLNLTPRDERLDPAKSARAAAQYLRALYAQFGSWPLAFAAYNAGDGRVARTRGKEKDATFARIADKLPLETQMYVPKVFATVALREDVDPVTLPPPRQKNATAEIRPIEIHMKNDEVAL